MPKLTTIERAYLVGQQDFHGRTDRNPDTIEEQEAYESGRNHVAYETQLELSGLFPTQIAMGF